MGLITAPTVLNSLKIDTIPLLLQQDPNYYYDVLGYHKLNDCVQRQFYYDPEMNRDLHNGGNIIDPTKTFPTSWADEVQKLAWFTPNVVENPLAENPTGCWRSIATNLQPDGRAFGIVDDGLVVPITDNTIALQNALTILGTVYLPSSIYKVTTILLDENYKLLCSDNGDIKLVSIKPTIFRATGNKRVDGFEFHGVLETTAVAATYTQTEALICNSTFTGKLSNWDISGIEYRSFSSNTSGLYLSASDGKGTFCTLRNIDASGSQLTCGDIGIQIENIENDIKVINIANNIIYVDNTISMNGLSATGVISTITTALPFPLTSRLPDSTTVLFKYIQGTGDIAKLNEEFFTVVNVTPDSFQLKDAAGKVLPLTGTYLTGGYVEVFRVDNVNLNDVIVNNSNIDQTTGIGIYINGPAINCKLDNVNGYNADGAIIRIHGLNKSSIKGLKGFNSASYLVNCIGWRRGYSNYFQDWSTVGRAVGNFNIVNQTRLTATDFDISSVDTCQISDTNDSFFGNHKLRNSLGGPCLAVTGNSSGSYQTTNNNQFSGLLLDGLDSTNATSPVSFSGIYCYKNTVDKLTLILPTTIPSPIYQWGGAANNIVDRWRYRDSLTWEGSTDTSTLANYRVLTLNNYIKDTINIAILATNLTGGQPLAHFIVNYSARYNNTPKGGVIDIFFGSANDLLADPVVNLTGEGEPVIIASGSDSLVSGQLAVVTPLTADCIISYNRVSDSGTVGALYDKERTLTGFTLASTSSTDTSEVNWAITSTNLSSLATPVPVLIFKGILNSYATWTLQFPTITISDIQVDAIVQSGYSTYYRVSGT